MHDLAIQAELHEPVERLVSMTNHRQLVTTMLEDLVDDEGADGVAWLATPDGETHLRLTRLCGNRTDGLRGLPIRHGSGLTGSVVEAVRPRWVDDYFESIDITHEFDALVAAEGITRMASVPVPLPERTAVLTIGLRTQGEFTGRFLDHLAGVGRKAGATLSASPAPSTRMADLETLMVALSDRLASVRRSAVDDDAREALLDVEVELIRAAGELCPHREVPPSTLLKEREFQILELVSLGRTNVAIGRQLGLTPNTVKTYLQSAMRKLGVGNRAEAVSRAFALDLLHPAVPQDNRFGPAAAAGRVAV